MGTVSSCKSNKVNISDYLDEYNNGKLTIEQFKEKIIENQEGISWTKKNDVKSVKINDNIAIIMKDNRTDLLYLGEYAQDLNRMCYANGEGTLVVKNYIYIGKFNWKPVLDGYMRVNSRHGTGKLYKNGKLIKKGKWYDHEFVEGVQFNKKFKCVGKFNNNSLYDGKIYTKNKNELYGIVKYGHMTKSSTGGTNSPPKYNDVKYF